MWVNGKFIQLKKYMLRRFNSNLFYVKQTIIFNRVMYVLSIF